jgi:phenylpyruvate tautomerase PptA (4-oxalocrotonate tautomerase family)
MHIRLTERKLSDGSHVYEVAVHASAMAAVSLEDAAELVERITAAVEEHTGEPVTYQEVQE